MGHARPRPKRLAEKLLQIRISRELSQSQIAERVGIVDYTIISKYEHGLNEPPLMTLLAYAKFAEIPVESLIDDQIHI